MPTKRAAGRSARRWRSTRPARCVCPVACDAGYGIDYPPVSVPQLASARQCAKQTARGCSVRPGGGWRGNSRLSDRASRRLYWTPEPPEAKTKYENDDRDEEDASENKKPRQQRLIGFGFGVTLLASELVSFLLPNADVDSLEVLGTTGSLTLLAPRGSGGRTRVTLRSNRCRRSLALGMAALRTRPRFGRNLSATRRTRSQ
jgi:hypothetical protein